MNNKSKYIHTGQLIFLLNSPEAVVGFNDALRCLRAKDNPEDTDYYRIYIESRLKNNEPLNPFDEAALEVIGYLGYLEKKNGRV